MSKNPYEIRLELIELARSQVHQRYFAEWEKAAKASEINESAQFLSEVPHFPTTEDILTEAEKLKRFVDKP